MISEQEQAALRAEVDSGTYDISSAMDTLARSTKGSMVRSALYKVVYWLKRNYASSAAGLESRQPLMSAGANISISTDPSNPTKQRVTGIDTRNTVGNGVKDLQDRNYIVLTTGTGTSGSYSQSYVNEGTYIDGDGKLKVGGNTLEYAKDYITHTDAATNVGPNGHVYGDDVSIGPGKYIVNVSIAAYDGTPGSSGMGKTQTRLYALYGGSYHVVKINDTYVPNTATQHLASLTAIADLPEGTTKVYAQFDNLSQITFGRVSIQLEVM